MPKRRSDSIRRMIFLEYLKWYVRGGANPRDTITVPDHRSGNISKVVKFTDGMAAGMAGKLMIGYESHIPDLVTVAESFVSWDVVRVAKGNSKRASTGGHGKEAKRVAKKGAGVDTKRKKPRFNLKKYNQKIKS